ncbi:MAG: glycosyltransferase family 39 protein, partial [Elusimicrobia bacterium]|nr:glycosyltransferase family 39 protein [Elusimicrobiota bacterium]
MKQINFKNSSFTIFIVISIFYLIGSLIWWKINTPIIPQSICALHFLDISTNSLLYDNAPLITWIMKGIFFVFGKEYFDLQIIIMNYFFFLIGLYFIYKIGLELKDKETGNIAMVSFALTPIVYDLSRQYGHQDWHVMIAMIPNIYCLIKLNDFRDRKWSILYGITVGVGLLIKDEFLPYFFTPWLYVVVKSLIEKTDKKKIINILITILIGSLIAGCHYFRLETINKILHEPINETAPVFTFQNFKIMTIGLSEYLLSLPTFILFIISLLYFVFEYKNKYKPVFLLLILVPWMIITFMPHHKAPEYAIGIIPIIIIFISLFISDIEKKYIKQIIICFYILILFLQFFYFSYNKDVYNFGIMSYKNYNFYYFSKVITKQNELSIELSKILNSFPDNYIFYIQSKAGFDRFAMSVLNWKEGYNREIKDFYDVPL